MRRAADVELADGEGVDERDRVARHVAGDGAGHDLGHDEQLAEAALRFRVLADHAVTAGAAVDQPDRHGGDPGAHRELVGAAGTVADDLADELVAHDDVAVGVVDEHRSVPPLVTSSGWSMKCTSEAQIAVLSVRSSSSPGPGTGSGVSRTSSRPPRNTTARISFSPRSVEVRAARCRWKNQAHQGEASAGDLPAVVGRDELVVVEAVAAHAGWLSGHMTMAST